MSMPWEGFSSRPVSLVIRVLSRAFLVLVTTAVARPSMAQQTPTPQAQEYRGTSQTQSYQGAFSDLANEIDVFWADAFVGEELTYESPNIFVVERETQTACGLVAPQPNAFYCPFDRTIYLVPQFLIDLERQFGDYAPITVFSHEWGHHVQAILGIEGPTPKDFELQADCLMGVFTRHADEEGLLDYGDFMEAMSATLVAGDEVFLPEDDPDAHGRPEDRVKALVTGYGGGPVTGCRLPLSELQDAASVSVSSRSSASDPEVTESTGERTTLGVLPEIFGYLPTSLPLTHASCFGIVDDGMLGFEQLLGRFSGVQDAATRLQTWDWQASAFRQFGCDGPPEGEAGWIDISVHLFGDPLAAQEAVDYFAAVRAEGGPLFPVAPPAIGDHAAALSGPASNGKEFTIYASQGPLLVRVTGVSPSGIPFINVLTVTQAVLAAQQEQPQLAPTPSEHEASLPASSYLPASPAVRHRECFEVLTEGTYSYSDVVSALLTWGLTQSEIDGFGWQDGAYRVFTCDEPPVGRATQIDVVIHQFLDAQSAQQAVQYFSGTYGLGTNEIRSCDTAGHQVICVTGRSLTGSPLSDVHFVLQDVLSAVGQ